MTVKNCCKYGGFGSFEHLHFLFNVNETERVKDVFLSFFFFFERGRGGGGGWFI